RSVPFFTRKPLLETVKGFLRLDSFDASCGAVPVEHQLCSMPSIRMNVPSRQCNDFYTVVCCYEDRIIWVANRSGTTRQDDWNRSILKVDENKG
ncbi:hypothetical protein HX021_21170, partial [Sphingobacterium sp. N143]|uniref:hypothetical protein n=1 Tax=Sphingobacterium sp. N143 TaxID=2746727 RepID=UPI00257610B3